MGMEFTGERFVPSLKGQIYYEHLHRYAIAVRASRGKRVLDVASGEGYGAALLARYAADVVGVDIDEVSIAHSRRSYYMPNLRFVIAPATELPLPDASVDVITCFETIEHLTDHDRMLDEFRRVLAPGGSLFISSPNKLVYSDRPNYQNPFHVRELYYQEFRDLLKRRFAGVAIYGQSLIASSVLHPLAGVRSDSAGWYAGDVTTIDDGLPCLADPVYFFAVCSDGFLDEQVASGFIDPEHNLFNHLLQELNAMREYAYSSGHALPPPEHAAANALAAASSRVPDQADGAADELRNRIVELEVALEAERQSRTDADALAVANAAEFEAQRQRAVDAEARIQAGAAELEAAEQRVEVERAARGAVEAELTLIRERALEADRLGVALETERRLRSQASAHEQARVAELDVERQRAAAAEAGQQAGAAELEAAERRTEVERAARRALEDDLASLRKRSVEADRLESALETERRLRSEASAHEQARVAELDVERQRAAAAEARQQTGAAELEAAERRVEVERAARRALEDDLSSLRSRAAESAHLEALCAEERDALERKVVRLEAEAQSMISSHSAVASELSAQIDRVHRLERETAELAPLVEMLRERDKEIAIFRRAIAECNVTIEARDAIVAECQEALAGSDAVIAERDALLAARKAAIESRDSRIAELNRGLIERDAALAECNLMLARRDVVIVAGDARIAKLEQDLAEADTERDFGVAQRDGRIAELQRCLAETEGALAELTKRAERDSLALRSVLSSRSWKITEPMRRAVSIVRPARNAE